MVADWLSTAGDVASAYIADRRSDDPNIYRRIVITESESSGLSYLVHAPTMTSVWIVVDVRQESKAESFKSLRAALNSIRRVLGDDGIG